MILLPYPSFAHSVACLDRVRLGNMRLYIGKVLAGLQAPSSFTEPRDLDMWRGHESALAVLMTLASREWDARSHRQVMSRPYGDDWLRAPLYEQYNIVPDARYADAPEWLGDPALHSRHRSLLLYLEPTHYGAFNWHDEPRQCTRYLLREGTTA